jgi:hypothetical protein
MTNILSYGFNQFANKSVFSNIAEYYNTSKSGFGDMTIVDPNTGNVMVIGTGVIVAIVLVGLVMFVLAFIAVGKIVKGNSDRARNLRLILRIVLFLSGGSLSLIFVLLWIFGAKFGDPGVN